MNDTASTVASGDGWIFWSKVYDDAELRHSMNQKSMQSPTMAELLASPLLCRAELVFLNVPRMSVTQSNIIRQLIHKHVRPNVNVLDIVITNRRWILRFLKKEEAVDVMTRMDGFKYRGKCLMVRINNNECYAKNDDSSTRLFEKLGIASSVEEVVDNSSNGEKDLIWTKAELLEINSFKRELIDVVIRKEGSVCPLSCIDGMANMRRRGLISDALNMWPLGLVRMFTPEMRLTGRYMSVLGRDDHAALIRQASSEGPLIPLEEWEAIPSMNVRTDFQLVAYTSALLSHFGPQHVLVDLPWRLVCHSVRAQWPLTTLELASLVSDKSTCIILYNDVLYLISLIHHRRALLQVLQPSPPQTSPSL